MVNYLHIVLTFVIIGFVIFLGIFVVEQYITFPCKDYFCNISNINLDEKYNLCCIVNNSLS